MSRALRMAAFTALAVLMSIGVASASHQDNGNDGSPEDFAVGTGKSGDMQVAFSAHGGPGTEDVTGHFRAGGAILDGPGNEEVGAFQFLGPVTCLVVDGNRAGLFYPIKQAKTDPEELEEGFERSGVFIYLKDGGKQGSDELGFAGPVPLENAPACTLGPTEPIDKGNITVHDADGN